MTNIKEPIWFAESDSMKLSRAIKEREELSAAFGPIWKAWHTVPYDNEAMNKAVRAMFALLNTQKETNQ